MNLGYSIELALKALVVQQDPDVIPKSGEIRIKTHNLVMLANWAGVTLSSKETELLNRLRDYIEWGRYPTKTKPSEYVESFDDSSLFHPKVSFALREFCDPLFALRDRLSQEYLQRQNA